MAVLFQSQHLILCVDVYLPARTYIGKLGAVLATYLASAMLHVSR